jgi:hypothetical protein
MRQSAKCDERVLSSNVYADSEMFGGATFYEEDAQCSQLFQPYRIKISGG